MRFDEDAQTFLAPSPLGPVFDEIVETLAVQSGEMTVLRAQLDYASRCIVQLERQVRALEDLNVQLAEEVDDLNAELAETDELVIAATRNVDNVLELLASRGADGGVGWAGSASRCRTRSTSCSTPPAWRKGWSTP